RFRLLPLQPEPPADLLVQIAENAILRTPHGWTWKYDPEALTRFRDADIDAMAQRLTCPTAFVYGSESVVVDSALAEYFSDVAPAPVAVHRVEGAYHHVILDAPRECAILIEEAARSFASAAERG
ncbi:MAG: alpha/beta hydrolase, partial [Aeromicrobium sp.]